MAMFSCSRSSLRLALVIGFHLALVIGFQIGFHLALVIGFQIGFHLALLIGALLIESKNAKLNAKWNPINNA
eukprot:626294-Prorocentrum_minimum.AAC.1